MKHFCTVPGVYNADKVIVQSEDMLHHNRFPRLLIQLHNTAAISIIRITDLDCSVKKIIFYNTSVAGLLAHNDKMLAKMEYVFRTFKENQDEVALLWRPHPLIKLYLPLCQTSVSRVREFCSRDIMTRIQTGASARCTMRQTNILPMYQSHDMIHMILKNIDRI